MTDPFGLQRFLDAQAPVYARVVAEVRRGQKQSQWMWFIFHSLPDSDIAQWPSASQSPLAKRPSDILAMPSWDPALKNARRSSMLLRAVQSGKSWAVQTI